MGKSNCRTGTILAGAHRARLLWQSDRMMNQHTLRDAFSVYLEEMERCEKAAAYWALLHLCVTMPDVCASVDADLHSRKRGRYVEWCRRHFRSAPTMTAGDRYQMRNAVLHEGSTLPTNRSQQPDEHTQYRSFSFVQPGATNFEVHQNVSPDGTNVTIDVKVLATETREAMEHWMTETCADAPRIAQVRSNLTRLARKQVKQSVVQRNGFGGVPQFAIVQHITTSST